MRNVDNKYKCLPFWSWNSNLKEDLLIKQIDWMHDNGVGGFFMHARGGLTTEYLGEQWFKCVEACEKRAEELGMHAYAYDENGWPSGFVGGKLLDDIENHDRYWTYKEGKYDPNATVSYDLSSNSLKRVTGGDNCLNVYMNYSACTADVLNGEVMDKFIKMTHEEYAKRDHYNLKGFFTDEPQYYRWGVPYSKTVAEYFKEVYKEDVLDGIGYLFCEKEGYRKFRYQYWKCLQALMLKNFAKKIYDWCDERNYKLTGHYCEENFLGGQMWCCAGIMPFYEFEHIPGVDWLCRPIGNEINPKQVGSVAAQLGKKQVLTETFACAGWDVSPIELKHIAEFLYVNGVNLMCQHLLPYKENGQRKRDYPAHFSAVNPWVRANFRQFNDYFSVLGEILSKSEEIVNVAVLHPLRSVYFNYRRDHESVGYDICELEESFVEIGNTLSQKGIQHHYLDETLLAKYGSVSGNKLVMGKCSYQYIVLPLIYTMDESTEKLLKTFVENGGKVLLTNGKPSFVEWRPYDYPYLNTNTSYEEMINSQDFIQDENENVKLAYRIDEDGKPFIFIVNLSEKEQDLMVKFKKYSTFNEYNILKDSYKVISNKIHLNKYESKVLYVSSDDIEAAKELLPIKLANRFEVVGEVENYLTLDFIRYSIDGKNYSEPLHHMGIFNEMLEKRYDGDLYLKYDFNVNDIPSICSACIEDENIKEVYINDVLIQDIGLIEDDEWREYNIAKYLHAGTNTITLVMNYHQNEDVYYALFGENVTESLKNCLAYTSNIEAIYLKGNFGVFGDFEPGKNENILLGNNFYLAEPKKYVTSLIEDGYPFFNGQIHLRQQIAISNTEVYLQFNKRFHLVDVSINKNDFDRLMFDEKLDISSKLKQGNNQIDLILTVGKRNLMGPFHTPEQESTSVGPYTFERLGTWKNGKSSILKEKYAFIKTII